MKIFVYGTLKRGHGNNGYLQGSRFLGEFRTRPNYDLRMAGGLPVLALGNNQVLGEIYEVDRETLRRLDRLEGHPYMYRRTPIEIDGEWAEGYLGAELLEGDTRPVTPQNGIQTYQGWRTP